MSSDIEHWHINATVFKDRVEEIHFISDTARNIRRRQHTQTWQVERFLGRGGFGEVRLERNKDDGMERAVKRIPTTSATLSNNECEKELKALLEFSKPKSREAAVFVDFFGWFRDGSDVFLAMEYVSLGDLEKNVKAHSGKIPENEARDIAEQILSGLEIMHAESFAHRDLKPQNVLVVNGPPQWWVKLADFGLSKKLTDTTAYYTKGGTQSYMAPEILNLLGPKVSSSEYTNAVDIWAVGCIVYRLIAGVVPFPPGTLLMEFCKDKSLFPHDPLFDSGIRSEGSRFMRHLLATNPKERPSATAALEHPWIVSGSKKPRKSLELPRQVIDTTAGLSELTVSGIGFNTVTHDGLKSLQSSSTHSTLDPNSHISGASMLSSSSTNTDLSGATPSIIRKPVAVSAVVSNPISDPTIRAPTEAQTIVPAASVEAVRTAIHSPIPQAVTPRYPVPNGPDDQPLGSHRTRTPPDVPPGWKAAWDEYLKQWTYIDPATGVAQMHNPQRPAISTVPEGLDSADHIKTLDGYQAQYVDLLPQVPTVPEGWRAHWNKEENGWYALQFPFIYESHDMLSDAGSRAVLVLMKNPKSHEGWMKLFQNPAKYDQILESLPILQDPDLQNFVRSPQFMSLVTSPQLLNQLRQVPRWLSDLAIANARMVVEKTSSSSSADVSALVSMNRFNAMHQASSNKASYGTGTPESIKLPASVRALWDFEPEDGADLRLKEGDIITVVEMTTDEWWKGAVGTRSGNFPANRVKLIPVLTKEEIARANITHVRALFDFIPTESLELEFKKYDKIRVTKSIYDDWWEGEHPDGTRGIFPRNYVEAIYPRTDPLIPPPTEYEDLVERLSRQTNESWARNCVLTERTEKSEHGPYHTYKDRPHGDEVRTAILAAEADIRLSNATKPVQQVESGRLTISVFDARSIYSGTEPGYTSCEFTLDKLLIHRTSIIGPTFSPVWCDVFTTDVSAPLLRRLNCLLKTWPADDGYVSTSSTVIAIGEVDIATLAFTVGEKTYHQVQLSAVYPHSFRPKTNGTLWLNFEFFPGALVASQDDVGNTATTRSGPVDSRSRQSPNKLVTTAGVERQVQRASRPTSSSLAKSSSQFTDGTNKIARQPHPMSLAPRSIAPLDPNMGKLTVFGFGITNEGFKIDPKLLFSCQFSLDKCALHTSAVAGPVREPHWEETFTVDVFDRRLAKLEYVINAADPPSETDRNTSFGVHNGGSVELKDVVPGKAKYWSFLPSYPRNGDGAARMAPEKFTVVLSFEPCALELPQSRVGEREGRPSPIPSSLAVANGHVRSASSGASERLTPQKALPQRKSTEDIPSGGSSGNEKLPGKTQNKGPLRALWDIYGKRK